MIVVTVARNGQLQQRASQSHAEAVLPNAISIATIRAVERGEKKLQTLFREHAIHDEDGKRVGKHREAAGRITLLSADFSDVVDIGADVAAACGHKTVQAFRDEWYGRHPRSERALVVWFALGDWRDRDLFMNWSGRAGGDFCVDEETEALTKRGWLKYDEITLGDELLGYDIKSHATRWEKPTGLHVFPDRERELIRLSGRSGALVSTPNHRWPVSVRGTTEREERLTEGLGDSHLLGAAPCSSLPREAIYSDAFVEIVAWFCTEGSQKRYRRGQLRRTLSISQSQGANPEKVSDIARALDEIAPGHWYFGAPPNKRAELKIFCLDAEASQPILAVAPDKVMTTEFVNALTYDQLWLLWITWIRADGSFDKTPGGTEGVGQKSLERLEPLQMALTLRGEPSSLHGRSNQPYWILRRLKRKTISPASMKRERIAHSGVVWCPTTPSTYWVARRDGRPFITGNTRNRARALDGDAPVLTREEIEALSSVNRQKDEARRAQASAALAKETPSQRLQRLLLLAEQIGGEATRAIRQERRIIEQRMRRAEGRK